MTLKTVAIIGAIVAPILAGAVGYGALYERVDGISISMKDNNEWRDKTNDTLNRLNTTLVLLSASLDNMKDKKQ